MANFAPRTITLKVSNQYSDQNLQRITEKIEQVHGVDRVVVDRENGMFTINGRVDPQLLTNYLESENILFKLVMFDMDSNYESEASEIPNPGRSRRAGNNGGGGARTEENCCRPPDKKKVRKPKKEEEHICEPYEALKIDPAICRDIYCKDHKSRAYVHSKVPSIHSEDHPRHNMHGHGHGHGYGLSFAGNHPFMHGGGGPPMFGHGQFPMMPPRYPSGFPPAGNHMPGFNNHGYYGHPAARGPRPFMGPFM